MVVLPNQSYTTSVSPDYAVEHVTDRIASKLPQLDQPSSLVDTGYRVRTRTLVVDSESVSPEATIEDVYSGSDEEIVSRILYQSESLSSVYDFGDENDYVAYLNASGDNGKTEHPQDVVFAYDTTQGEMIEDIRYDRDSGIAYIPKTFFGNERLKELDDNQSELQAQTLVRCDLGKVQEAYGQDKLADTVGTEAAVGELSAANTIPAEIETESGKASKMAQVPHVGNQFAINITSKDEASSIGIYDINIDINDGAITLSGADDEYIEGSNMPSISYDSSTGDLNVHNVSPMSVMNVQTSISARVTPSMASRAALATAGEIVDPTDNAYSIGFYGQANASGWTTSDYDATTKTIRRWGPGESVQQFSDITIAHLSDQTCAYVIAIGSCPSALGSSWTANGSTRWKADCVHAYYPNGSANPPSGGYYKVLDADWNNQAVTVAFFITCNSSGQEGAIVLTFSAPRNGTFEIYKKANANPSLGSAWKLNVPGATFGVYNSLAAAQAAGSSGLVKKLTTDSSGVALGSFEEGTYWVRELSAPWPYIKTDQIVSFSAKPRSKDRATIYDDSVPPIQIKKFIVPSADSFSEADVMSGSSVLLHAKTEVSSDGRNISTEITAKADVDSVSVSNLAPSVLQNPTSVDDRFDASTGRISQLKAGESVILTQDVKAGAGWSNRTTLASICSISVGAARTDMSLKLHAMSLSGVRYGIYADEPCTNKLGEAVLDENGVGYYGKKSGEWLASNTRYYVKEVAGANGYTVSNSVYPVTTARNSQVSVNVSDSFSTFILTKESGAGKSLTDVLPQFALKGAKYGVFTDRNSAELHDESKVTSTLDGRPAVIETDKFGKATEVALGAGAYYVAELPSAVTRPWEYGKVNDDFSEPDDIDAEISSHDYSSKSNGKFLLDENIYTVTMKPGGTTFQTSEENIPVRIQLQKQSTRADLATLSQFSLEGAVFGVYETEAVAQAAPTGNYKEDGFFLSSEGAVALLYGNENGTTTVSWDLPLQDYYIKEIRAPKNYKLLGASEWVLGKAHVEDQIIHVTPEDFLTSGKYIDGVLTNTSLVKSNEPADVSVQVQKQASEVPDGLKAPDNAMSLAGARFAIYKSFDDARADTNRLTFNTDDQAEGDSSKTDLLTSRDDGWTNKAIGLPAEECYWVREIEPPHVISADPVQNEKNIAESMYVLDSEPVKATFAASDSVEMKAYKDDVVKPVSITIGKYAMSMDAQGRNLHVGEKAPDGTPYNDAYTDSAFEGALFGLFETRERAEAAPTTDDVNDISVEQSAYDAGAIRVMMSDENGVCGTVDNLKWKPDGYYVKELKAPTSGCYKRNESILQVGCDKNTQDSEHIYVTIDQNKISKHFEVDEIPNYYYVKIEKTSTDPSVLADANNYDLEGIHFGIYKTQEEAEAATPNNPGAPLYNLYTKKVQHDDGTTHYEAISGLTGPGVFWAKELVPAGAAPVGFQTLTAPIRVEAKLGGIPRYDTTPIVPENSAPVFDKATGLLEYKTAKDIDKELGTHVANTASKGRAALGCLSAPAGAVMDNVNGAFLDTWAIQNSSVPVYYNASDGIGMARYSITVTGSHITLPYTNYNRYWANGAITQNAVLNEGTCSVPNTQSGWMVWVRNLTCIQVFLTSSASNSFAGMTQRYIAYWPQPTAGYKITGIQINGANAAFGTAYNVYSATTVTVKTAPLSYTVSFNANGGSGASAAKTVTYDAAMPTVTKPTRTGYIFQGYYDAARGGTQYYKADGTSARNWNKTTNTTLYAHWTPITYKVQYTATDPNASLAPGMTGASTTTTETYNKEGTLKSGIYHKFGYVSKAWKYTADDGSVKILTPGTSKLLNLTATNNKTVVLTAVWNLNEYYVKFNDGLSAQWGPAPVIERGTNPDTGTAWSLGYQQKLYYDDYATDGIASDTLTRVRYSHPYFTFKYWFDANGKKYSDMQSVQNLAAPNKVKELTGYWAPSFDYGVDCEPNIIPNQPIGGITIQKTVKTSGAEPGALTDLSGIVFELFTDSSCTQSVASSITDEKGVAAFSDVEAGKTYYVKEKSIPDRLASSMQMSDEVKEVRAGMATSYEFANECKQLSLRVTKSPSQQAIDAISPSILNGMAPVGAKFAVYATEQDARNDTNRIPFYNESGHISTVATVSKTTDTAGVACAETTMFGLPDQNLWVAELAAADFGKHEYVLSEDPVFVRRDSAEVSNGSLGVFVTLFNDMPYLPSCEASKRLSSENLSRIPEALHDDAAELLDGITYAMYLDAGDAAIRSDDYAELLRVEDGKAILPNLPMGTYYLIEWELPEAAVKAGISRSDKVIALEVSDPATAPDIVATDSLTAKKMYISKIDSDTKEPIAGVVFDIYTDETESELLCSTTATDAQGLAVSTSALLAGRSYFVHERYDSMPADYNGNGVGSDASWSGWIEIALSDTAEDAFVVENQKNDEKGSIEVRKTSNTGADVSGAVFSVYDSTGMLCGDMTTNQDGIARIDDIPVGAYTVQETATPVLHAATDDGSDAPIFEGIVRPDETWQVNDGEPVMNYQGYVRVHKESSAPEVTDATADIYSLAGAVYSLYPIEGGYPSATPIAATMITDEKGECEPVAVPLGSYKVVETTEPANFSTPEDQKEFYIDVTIDNATPDRAVVIESKDEPASEPLANFLIEKRSAETYETSDGSPQGTTSMEGTKFSIEYAPVQAASYADALSVEKTRKWVVATDADGRAIFDEQSIIEGESDPIYRDANGQAVLPVGTIVVREIDPPVGYSLGKAPTAAYRFNGQTQRFEELFSDTDEIKQWDGTPTFTAANDIYRADISFRKVDAYDHDKVMANIPFALTLLGEDGAAIERHLVSTDENGCFSSAIGSIEQVNGNDQWIPGNVESGCVDAAFAPNDSRVWFSGARVDVVPSADKGALIYGDYELREYRRDDTQHYQSLEPIRFSVRGDDERSWIEVDGKKIENGDLTDAIGEIENHSVHITSTELLDTTTGAHSMGTDSLLATETITYADATANEKYIFEAYAYDMDTGEPVMKTFEDVDGTVVDVQAGGAYTLLSDSASGSVSIDISFEGYDVAGRKLGIVTRVYHDGYLSDEHNADLSDEAESVSFATMGTVAIDNDTSQHIGLSDGHIDITDTVEYRNLVPGCEYVAQGVLMDKETGSALRDAYGNTIESETVFVPTERDGQAEVRFSFDKPSNEAFTAVAFEKILIGGECVAKHEDIEDAAQTVSYPAVQTVAKDKATRTFQGNAEKGSIDVIDTVSYENLIAGAPYEVRGVLYVLDADGNKTVIEGTQTVQMFVPEAQTGSVEMTFSADSSAVRGLRVLVGEEIWSDGKIVASHDDAAFEDQIASYPSVATTATDVVSGLHVGNGESSCKIKDVVCLEGLKAGEQYRIDGTVMVRSSDGSVEQTHVTAREVFIAASPNEEHTLVFDLPAGIPGRDAVVFEKLSAGDGAFLLATHEDAHDEGQSVHYPRVSTRAWDSNTQTQVGSNILNHVTDTVEYENLVPEYTYEVVGMLVDKETGEFLSNAEETAPVVSTVPLAPTACSGTIDVPFDLEGIDVRGRTLVAFEQLFVKDAHGSKTLVATHCDIDADKQTMFYPALSTTARDAATETHVGSSLTEACISDVVEYSNVVAGYEYEVHGILMDKQTAEPIAVDGETVEATAKFVASETSGAVEVVFEGIPCDIAQDKTIVVFEKLLLAGVEMAHHEDIDDAAQSVSYPVISTLATDAVTKLHEGNATPPEAAKPDAVSSIEDGTVTVIDTVEYSNLVAGIEYKLEGALIDKETGQKVAESEALFVADENSGKTQLTISMDAEEARGRVLVAFEKLIDAGGNVLASHEDIEDEGQTVSYPTLSTTARDRRTETRAGSTEDISIVDTVRYEGLLAGHEYEMTATLMDKETGTAVASQNGEPISGSTIFAASEGGRGEVEVELNSPTPEGFDLSGKTLVVFEELREAPAGDSAGSTPENPDSANRDNAAGDTVIGDGETIENPDQGADSDSAANDEQAGGNAASDTVIASHQDIADEQQAIHYANITRTLARADSGSKLLDKSDAAIMLDTVIYENAVPGVEYTLTGSLMSKHAEETVVASGKMVTAEKTFVAQSESGEVEVTFELDTTTADITDTVVFEHMTVSDAIVAQHTDYDSEDQSIHGVADDLVETGTLSGTSDVLVWLLAMAGCIAASFGGIALMRSRRSGI